MKLLPLILVAPMVCAMACSRPQQVGDASTAGGTPVPAEQAATAASSPASTPPANLSAGDPDVRVVKTGAHPVTCNIRTRVCSDGLTPESDHFGHLLDASKAKNW